MADFDDQPSHYTVQVPAPENQQPAEGNDNFVFGHNCAAINVDSLSPLPSQMPFIWHTFVNNVDPFIKVLHLPTVNTIIQGLNGTITSLSPNMEALLFSISLATITSMDEVGVVANFNTPKPQLISRYRLGAELALGRAKFVMTKDITVIQAFVIYLSVLPYLGATESAWSLTGLLLRLAKSLGLHRANDGIRRTDLELETRRRLWWQICLLDSKTRRSNMADLSISETSFDQVFPANINDTDLGSLLPTDHPSIPRTGDMTLCLIRCELWTLVQSLKASPAGREGKLGLFYETKLKIETKYLHPLGPGDTLGDYIKTMASLFFAKAELFLHKPSATEASRVQNKHQVDCLLLRASVTVISAVHALLTDPSWTRWRWQLSGTAPWHAIGIFLRHACSHPWASETERVWSMVQRLAVPKEGQNFAIWQPLMRLFTQTTQYRSRALDHVAVERTDELGLGERLTQLGIRGSTGGNANPVPEPDQNLWETSLSIDTDTEMPPFQQSRDSLIDPDIIFYMASSHPTLQFPPINLEGLLQQPYASTTEQANDGSLPDWHLGDVGDIDMMWELF